MRQTDTIQPPVYEEACRLLHHDGPYALQFGGERGFAIRPRPDAFVLGEKIYNIDDNMVATETAYVHPTNMDLPVMIRFAI